MLFDTITSFSDDNTVSDFHIKEGAPVRVRRAGVLEIAPDAAIVKREDILNLFERNEAHTGLKAKEVMEKLEPTGDLDAALKLGKRRFRANAYLANGRRLGLVLRQFPDAIPALSTLNLPAAYHEMIQATRGLVLVTGATGSGKSTTLASTLEHCNQSVDGHIITIEDPVEYLLTSKRCTVDQRQIGRDVRDFQTGLRAALRQDPDILLVGELRDPETVKTALDAANTGHLVFATLHTNSAQQSIDRISSFFPPERQGWVQATLSQVLLGIQSQVLVPRRNGQGRALALELLVNTQDVRQLIREGRTHQLFNAMDTGSSKGHLLLNRHLVRLVKDGTISPDDALLSTYDVAALKKELSRA